MSPASCSVPESNSGVIFEASTAFAVDLDRRVGDDVGSVERVLVGLGAVACVDIVDQPFVERPGVHAAFPIVDDSVAEAVDFRLLIGDARCLPRLPGSGQRFRRGLGDQRVGRLIEQLGGCERVLILGQRDISVGREHRFRVRLRFCRQHENRGRQRRRCSNCRQPSRQPRCGYNHCPLLSTIASRSQRGMKHRSWSAREPTDLSAHRAAAMSMVGKFGPVGQPTAERRGRPRLARQHSVLQSKGFKAQPSKVYK